MNSWMLVIYLFSGSPNYEIWGYFKTQESCQKSISKLEKHYEEKRKTLSAECFNISPVQFESKQ